MLHFSTEIARINKRFQIRIILMYVDLGFQGNYLTPNSLRENRLLKIPCQASEKTGVRFSTKNLRSPLTNLDFEDPKIRGP